MESAHVGGTFVHWHSGWKKADERNSFVNPKTNSIIVRPRHTGRTISSSVSREVAKIYKNNNMKR